MEETPMFSQSFQAAMMNAYIKQIPFSEIRLSTTFRNAYFWTEVGA
jgi:hypothetical protein